MLVWEEDLSASKTVPGAAPALPLAPAVTARVVETSADRGPPRAAAATATQLQRVSAADKRIINGLSLIHI